MVQSSLIHYELWARRFMQVALLALSGYFIVMLFLSFTVPPADLVLSDIGPVSNTKQQETSSVTATALFGTLTVEEQAFAKPTKKTTLKLTLKGVMPSLEMDNAMAIVATAGKKDEIFQVGDKIVAGVILKAVYSDHIILDRAGNAESLFFAENDLLTLIENVVGQAIEKNTNDTASSNDSFVNQDEKKSAGELLLLYEQEFNEDSTKLLNTMGLLATDNAYEVLGSSAFIDFGLKVGDKIVAINGRSVGNINNGDGSLGGIIREQSVAMFQVLRGSRSFSVSYPIN